MFARVVIFCAALAAVHASFVAPVGYGAPVLAAGHLGIRKGLIATPAVATVSSQKAVINHVAPAPQVAVASAPVALASHGILASGLVGGHGIAAAPLSVGAGIYGAPVSFRNLGLGHRSVASSQKSVINHVAPTAPVAVAAAPVALAGHGIYGNSIIAGNGFLANGIVGGHGIATRPLAIGTGHLSAPVALSHGAAVSSQRSVISHVAPAAPVAVAAAPVALAGHGIYGNGIIAGNGHLANGIVGGHGIATAPLSGHLVAPVALNHGAAVSSQKSVISHVAPAARVSFAAAPVALAHNGILRNGLIGGHGIVGNRLVAGTPLGIAGHGISALPFSSGSGIHGVPVAHGFGKSLL